MKTVKIKGLTIGSGRPKICVPIVAKDVSDAIIQAEKIETCDLVEIRGDYIDNYNNVEYVIELIKNVKKIIRLFLLSEQEMRVAKETFEFLHM